MFKEVNVTDIPEGLESEYEWNIKKEDFIPMVMVNDVLYLATGYEKETEEKQIINQSGLYIGDYLPSVLSLAYSIP